MKYVDRARKAVAIAMAICGAGCVVCAHVVEHKRTFTPWWEGSWAVWQAAGAAFFIGVLACLVATVILALEYVARPTASAPLTRRSLLIVITTIAVSIGMAIAFGPWQGIGAMIGSILLLAAVRSRHAARAILAVLAAVVLLPTLLSTRSVYQYARWHAREIVAAGDQLMDQFPGGRSEGIDVIDPRVPSVLRELDPLAIKVDEDRVVVYLDDEEEIEIYRTPPTGMSAWESMPLEGPGAWRMSGTWKITDRLWMRADKRYPFH